MKRIFFGMITFLCIFLSKAQDLPTNPQIGKCYIRVTTKDVWTNETITIKVSDAYTKLKIIPAEFETITENILIKAASSHMENGEIVKDSEIVHKVTTKVLVEKEKIQEIEIPAVYETIKKEILVKKGGLTKWISVDCKIINETNRLSLEIDRLDNEINDITDKINNTNGLNKEKLSVYLGYLRLVKEREHDRFYNLNQDIENYQLEKTNDKIDYIPNPIEEIIINFYNTKDGADSNQKVKNTLINGLREGLINSNDSLKKNKLDKLKSFSVSSTTNGSHSLNSNHYKYLAIDIFMLNGVKIDNYKISKYISENWKTLKKKLPKGKFKDRNFWKQIEIIHLSFDKVSNIRESFGPDYVRKKVNSEWFKKSNKLLNSHKNHFHFSFTD